MKDEPSLYKIEKDYGERRVDEFLAAGNVFGAVIICLNYAVTGKAMAKTLKACSEARLIEVIGKKEGYKINISSLSMDTMKDLLQIVWELNKDEPSKKPYQAIIEKI
jgi:hypothetical protein